MWVPAVFCLWSLPLTGSPWFKPLTLSTFSIRGDTAKYPGKVCILQLQISKHLSTARSVGFHHPFPNQEAKLNQSDSERKPEAPLKVIIGLSPHKNCWVAQSDHESPHNLSETTKAFQRHLCRSIPLAPFPDDSLFPVPKRTFRTDLSFSCEHRGPSRGRYI